MARRTGKDGYVKIGSTVVAHITSWTAEIRPVIYRRRPCHSATSVTVETHRYDQSGTFECESNPNDDGQDLLSLTGVTAAALMYLYENTSTIMTIRDAVIYGGVEVRRNGAVMRRFNWEA